MPGLFSPSRVLASLFVFFLTAQAAVPQSTWVGRPSGVSSNSNDNLTFAVNVPSGNSDELFFHISAPAGQTYAAFGIGDQMKGALMFVVYASADGKNVTVSPRIGTGQVQPKHTTDVQVEVLSGSGLIDGYYIVNAKCSNCRTWNGGSVDVTSDDVDMVWAIGPDGAIDTDDLGATIRQHLTHSSFNLDFAAATGEGGVPVPQASSDNTDNIGGPGRGSDDGPGGRNGAIAFHAFVMVAAFLAVFPLGVIFLRVFEKVWLHWAVQSVALIMTAVGTGTGVAISKNQGISPDLTHYHQILGFVILGLLLITWGVGLTGHVIFRRTGKPATIMKGHRVTGPLSMTLGLTNCFIGFSFANNRRAAIILAIATLLMIVGVATILFFARKRKMRKGAMTTPAAFNFREGQMEPQPAPYGPQSPRMPNYGQGGIPLQSYQHDQPPPMYR